MTRRLALAALLALAPAIALAQPRGPVYHDRAPRVHDRGPHIHQNTPVARS